MRLKSVFFLSLITFASPTFAQNSGPVFVGEYVQESQELDPQSFEVALLCTASLQIATLAAPEWSNEPAIANATNLWLARIHAIAPQNGIAGDKINDTIKAKMQELTNRAAYDPDYLNRLAFECALNSPS